MRVFDPAPVTVRDEDGWTMGHFQTRIESWMRGVFGDASHDDQRERTLRFLEEAIELAQAVGLTESDVGVVTDYVYNRPVGQPAQEVGGVMITLAALCEKTQINLEAAAITEFHRIDTDDTRVKIYKKQSFKRMHGL